MNKHNWDDVRFVLTVARVGSLNAAASELGVTHATVMRRVAAFEASHDQQIFVKSPSGYKVLPEAYPILRKMENIEEATIAMERTIAGADQSLSGSVRIASTDSMCNFILPAVIARITALHPRMELALLSANEHHDLSRLSADIVVRATNALDDSLTGQTVGKLSFGVFSDQSQNQKWLRLEGALSKSIPAKWMDVNIPQDQIIGGADSFMVLQRMAGLGMGKVLLPKFVGKADSRLSFVQSDAIEMGVPIWVATLKEFTHVPRIISVQKLLTKELQKSDILEKV